eukprot:SAG31_NODE_2354_length_5881_cov_7.980111_7_plen_81_part_00
MVYFMSASRLLDGVPDHLARVNTICSRVAAGRAAFGRATSVAWGIKLMLAHASVQVRTAYIAFVVCALCWGSCDNDLFCC